MKQYPGGAIQKMSELFQPVNAQAYNWLIEKGYRELVEAAEFIKTGRDQSFRWLVDHKHFEMAAFINAVKGDKKAFQWLMQNKSLFWAATANAINKDKQAMAWLKQNKFDVYVQLAQAIIEFEKLDNSDFSGYYKPPIS
ncbi:MAG TPA: hypothetical protein VI731_02510 [Bacteroidia bacterium]|nr:hypothetical protein [Bacteroidia bacterium]